MVNGGRHSLQNNDKQSHLPYVVPPPPHQQNGRITVAAYKSQSIIDSQQLPPPMPPTNMAPPLQTSLPQTQQRQQQQQPPPTAQTPQRVADILKLMTSKVNPLTAIAATPRTDLVEVQSSRPHIYASMGSMGSMGPMGSLSIGSLGLLAPIGPIGPIGSIDSLFKAPSSLVTSKSNKFLNNTLYIYLLHISIYQSISIIISLYI